MDPRIGSTSTEELLAQAGFLQRLTRELVGDAHAAADLAQDTWVVALEQPPRRDGSLRGWLATVAANLSRNARRSGDRRHERETRAARAETIESDELSHERIEVQRALFDLLLTLPDEQRTVLYLRYYEGLTPTAIAARLAVPVPTVKTRHTRALVALRERLDARSGGDRRVWLEALAPLAIPHAGSALGPVMGGLVMKKLAVAALVLALSFCAWWAFGRSATDGLAGTLGVGGTVELGDAGNAPTARALELATSTVPVRRESTAAPEPAGKGALDVRLSWSDGTPAADVGLVVRCASDPAPRAELQRAVTDAQGRAHLAELFAGDVTLRPDLREPFPATVEAGVTRTVAFTLPAALDVVGRVVGPDGGAAGSASIWCDGEEHANAQMRRAVACAADGTFRLRDVSSGAMFGARARSFLPSPCVTPSSLSIGPNGARTIELQLGLEGGRVHGRVLDPEGKPLAGARVLAGPRGGFQMRLPSGVNASAPVPAAVETAEDGTFELIDDLPLPEPKKPGPQPIHAAARGYPVWSGEVAVVAGKSTFIEIRLENPARVEGRVLDFEGRPVADAKVLAAKEDRGGWYWHVFPPLQCKSDAEGRFAFDWIAPGPCELNAHDFMRPEIGRAQATVECKAGATTTCELRMVQGRIIAGRVEDKDGAPLAGWTVYASNELPQWHPRQTRTAQDGSFRILNLGEGRHDLKVRGPGRIEVLAHLDGVKTGTNDAVLVVENAHESLGTLRGRVVDPDARSLDDVVVTLHEVGKRMGFFVTLEPNGSFERRTQPGHYRMSFQRGGIVLLNTPVFVVEADRVCELGDVEFPRPGSVELTFAGALDGATPILSRSDGWGGKTILTERDGVWSAQDVTPGTWTIHFEPFPRSLCARGAEVEVRTGETTRVEVPVEDVVRVNLWITGADPNDVQIDARDADGRLLLREQYGYDYERDGGIRSSIELPLGRATVEVRSAGRLGQAQVDVDPESAQANPTAIVVRAGG